MLLFVFAIACNILALLAALIIFLLLAFIDAWEPKPRLRLFMRSLSFLSAVIPAVGLWLCFNHRLGIGAGVGFSALATYLAVGRYLLYLIEFVARP